MRSSAGTSTLVGGSELRSSLAARAAKLAGALALVLGAGSLLTLTGASPPALAAGNVTPTVYVANYADGNTLAFPLTATGDVAPAATINATSNSLQPSGNAFDGSGDLWVADYVGGATTVDEYTPAQLATTGTPTPAVSISGASVANADALAFDGAGDLWVSQFSGAIAEFTPAQLSASGSPTPAVTLTTPAGGEWGVSFDSSGDLWTAGYFSGNNVFEFTPAQLAATGAPTPVVTLSGAGLNAPAFPTFDTQGDLWIANATSSGGTIVEFTASQIAASGSPTPAVTISGAAVNGVDGLAFDTSGNLWADGYLNGNQLVEYSPSQLAASGSPTPANTISGSNPTFDSPAGLAIAEAPAVTAVSPTSGPGGTKVTITGIGFLPGSTVNFGSAPATSVTYLSPTTLTAVAPAGSGNADVTVTSAFGTSATSAADLFSYGGGYREVASDGGIFSFNLPFAGSMGGKPLNAPIVGMATDKATGGYWEVASDGGIFAFNAPFFGSMGGKPLNKPIVGIAADPATGGYWEVASDGGIFSFNAPFAGSMGGKPLNKPIVGIAADPTTGGYWEVASDGGIFNFNAPFSGSMGGKPLNKPIVGLAADPTTSGYWEVASDGGIFNFNAPFLGSMGGKPLNAPMVGMAGTPDGAGYQEVASDGGIFSFNAPFFGSMGGKPLNKPIVGIAG